MSEYLQKVIFLSQSDYDTLAGGGTVSHDGTTFSGLNPSYIYLTDAGVTSNDLNNIIIPIENGGTGASSAAGALTNLGAAASTHSHDDTYVKKVTSTDNSVVRFDGTNGEVQSSKVSIDDDGNISINGATGTSPSIILQRGTDGDAFTDWKISDVSGKLSIQSRSGTSSWSERASFADNSGNLTVTGTINGYTLSAAAGKDVDTSISSGSSSTKLPTSAAVASFVEGKGYLGSTGAKGDILIWSDTNSASHLSAGTNGQVLTISSGVPAWGSASENQIIIVPVTYSSNTYSITYTYDEIKGFIADGKIVVLSYNTEYYYQRHDNVIAENTTPSFVFMSLNVSSGIQYYFQLQRNTSTGAAVIYRNANAHIVTEFQNIVNFIEYDNNQNAYILSAEGYLDIMYFVPVDSNVLDSTTQYYLTETLQIEDEQAYLQYYEPGRIYTLTETKAKEVSLNGTQEFQITAFYKGIINLNGTPTLRTIIVQGIYGNEDAQILSVTDTPIGGAANAVVSLTPGNGLINGTTGSSQSAITSSGTISIAEGGVTNAMLAGSIANSKLSNSTIKIGTQTISLGGEFTKSTLVSDLGLSTAMKYVGSLSSLPTATDANTYSTYNAGDVITISTSGKEYVYNKGETASASEWIELGGESSYKVVQTAVSDPSVPESGTTVASSFIDTISQDTQGVITATKKNLPFATSQVAGVVYCTSQNAMPLGTTVTNVSFTNTTSTNSEYPVLFKYSTGTTTTAAGTRFISATDKSVTINGSTGNLTVPTINKLTLTAATTGFTIAGGTTSKTLTVGESYTLGAACEKAITDNSSAADVTSADTNLITGRTLYYQLANKGYKTSSGVTSVTWNNSSKKIQQSIDSGTATDVLEFEAGSNITLTPASGKLTIAATGGIEIGTTSSTAMAGDTVVNKVKQSSSSTSADYKVLFGTTASPTSGTDYETYYGSLTYNPNTKALVTGGTVDGYTLAAAAAKGVTDNSSNGDVTSSDTNLITGRTLYYQLANKGYAAGNHTHGNITNNGSVGSGNNLLVTSSGAVTAGATISSAVSSQSQSTKFLREDGTWAAPSYTTNTDTHRAIKVDGTEKLSSSSTTALDLVAGSNISLTESSGAITIANTYSYTHPNGDGNLHVPANGTSNTGKFLKATGTAGSYEWSDLPSATSSAAGITTVGASGGAAEYSHTHSDYVEKTGDTMTGNLLIQGATLQLQESSSSSGYWEWTITSDGIELNYTSA